MAVKNTGIQLEPHQIIVRPLVTEKGTHQSERLNAYSFEVNPNATKYDIRAAVEALWDVRVVDVRTQNRKGKPRRHKMSIGYTRDWKKAIVQLHDEDRISFF
ncbi:50S ribosomal protein L23 [Maioricimonas rarisocia]|uniref:Large ribosomal subunit protein uL23 n=1 Tax=Maioricimonas rarisocia TaxID=2528026 RepID=A0A517ZBH3_9PLAN|nr:50S ribosomal protein L23 [Maioricimonas rarisocia]QDU39844.1 50S ribosomal protein L23 [Maioricimonas rarisocia]